MINLDFVQVPVSALINIKDTSIKVYSIIYTGCILMNNEFYHSYSQFVTELGVNIQYVKRALKDLKDAGYIEIESGRGMKKPNTYHLTNRVKSEPINDINRVKSEPINRVKSEPQKEYIKKYIDKYIVNNMDYNSSTSRDTTEQSDNNMNFDKIGMYMELNSHSAVQSKDWTKETKEEKTHSSSASTTKVIQIGDTRYAVKTANTDYSSIWDSFPGGTASREKKKVQQATTTEDRNDNTLSNASLHNENEDNPNEDKLTTAGQNTNHKTSLNSPKASGATETAHRGFNGAKVDNYTTNTDKMPQELNNDVNMDTHNPMDCGGMSIDDLENMFNGFNPTQTQPIYKGGSQTTSKAKSNEGGVGRKFTPRKEWELLMENINTKVNNNIMPTIGEMNIIMEGARDKYRVITTLKVLYKMLFFRLKVNGYGVILTTCGDTLDDNKEAYTHKQYDFACRTYDQCVDQFDIFKLENPTLNQ